VSYALLVLATTATVVGSLLYRNVALQRGIIAKISSRTLHDRTVARGGGLVFASVFAVGIFVSWLRGGLPAWVMLALGVGGMAAAVVGFIDDVYEVSALKKLATQICLSIWLFVVSYAPLYEQFVLNAGVIERALATVALIFIPVWLINLQNFIDGIDGMAISGSVFVCATGMIVLALTGVSSVTFFLFALLGASCLGFLFLNIPPARIFMGDSGSIFLGYCIAAILLLTVQTGEMSAWTWICMLSYFVADTTTTTISRMFLVKRWYGVHRSHAYQNLARIHKSHAKVTYGVALFNILWALPLSVWSAIRPEWGPLAALLSVAPPAVWTLRFGPRLSSD
jgi:Fuc2NAc and GlcNAc transferase